ncbi:hypothetical protein BD626DRAFT_548823 [Schizophyllum amplum]|uniref:Ferric reductase NAD binding domain-containing protein n=1 Tax=Schizophyllum amplum TaxID=97359 RepID=A0A550CBA4_9AGAR|nr:hypothetical protein BD626DRAFT_548823 [Auriculariopsis ampla]
MYAVLLGPQGDALANACDTVEELICAAGRESNAWLGRLPRLRKLTIVAVARPTARALADILRGRSNNQPELSNIDLWFSADCYEAVNTEALHELVCLGEECGVEVRHHVFTCERGALMEQWMVV